MKVNRRDFNVLKEKQKAVKSTLYVVNLDWRSDCRLSHNLSHLASANQIYIYKKKLYLYLEACVCLLSLCKYVYTHIIICRGKKKYFRAEQPSLFVPRLSVLSNATRSAEHCRA